MSLLPNEDDSPGRNRAEHSKLGEYSTYDLPSVASLISYFHAAVGYPVISTWLNAIKAGNYVSWPGFTYNIAARYCPSADENINGRLVQTRQGIRSTRKFLLYPPETPSVVPEEEQVEKPTQDSRSQPNKIHIHSIHTSKFYIDDTGRFPVRSRIGNHYIIVPYHSSNVILVAPFKTKKTSRKLPHTTPSCSA